MAPRGGGQGPREETSQDPATDPVLCSPYDPPDQHWPLDDFGQAVRGKPPNNGRRPPVRINVPQDRKSGRQQALKLKDREVNELVNEARAAIKQWRDDGYEGVTPTTLRLLQHWNDPQPPKSYRLFFAQVEAIETLIWLREVAIRTNPIRRELENAAREHNDDIVRLCSKMATGTGKTAVMGMAIAWQTLNAVHWQRTRNIMHTNRFVVFAPGHTVRQRLGVLAPSAPDNVYDEMGLVPQDLRKLLNQAKVRVVNFQTFTQKELIDDSKARQLLGKERGEDTESWDAAVRRVLGDILEGRHQGVCVINDEAHHCYLPPPRQKSDSEQKAEDGRAAVWFNTIRAMRDMGALGEGGPSYRQAHPVLDFSATPLWIDTASKSEPEQFQWVASDFGLMDAIESGLVKVPRVPIDDDSIRDETVWRKLYANTQAKDLTKYFQSNNQKRLPDPFNNAVNAVVKDWEKTLRAWQEGGQPIPPVIIFVVNNIRNATALYEYIAGYEDDNGKAHPGVFPELSNIDPNGSWHPQPRTLVVHSKVGESDAIPDPLKRLLVETAKLESKKDAEDAVRDMLNTVGKTDKPGQNVRCVVSVSMLTEGWDARTVTHIVGFRAFSTQLLCEQVTGRALRRTAYDSLREPDANGRQRFEPEYADVVGIPFEFMPDVGEPTVAPRLPKPRTRVVTMPGRQALRVAWPQVVEYLRIAPQGRFALELDRVAPWNPAPSSTASMALLEGSVGESSVISTTSERARERTAQAELAAKIASSLTQENRDDGLPAENDEDRDEMRSLGETSLFRSAFKAVGQWAAHPSVGNPDLIELAANGPLAQRATNAILGACDFYTNQPPRRARLAHPPITDTAKVDFETTLVHIHEAQNSELSHAACHSQLEKATAQALDQDRRVLRWVRNFQLGWTIPYYLNGVWRRYEPDFVAVLEGGVNLVVECKGAWDEKATVAAEWAENYWVPSLAGTVELPDHLRHWAYGVIDDPQSVKFQLEHAIQTALQKEQ